MRRDETGRVGIGLCHRDALAVNRPAGFSAPGGETPQAWPSGGLKVRKIRWLLGLARGMSLAPFLRSYATEHHMVRGAVLSIVLTLAVGPNTPLLCRIWCHPQADASTGCPHVDPTTSPSVADDPSCDEAVQSAAAVVPEEVRRVVSAPDTDHAIQVTRYQLASSTTGRRPRHECRRGWSLERRPLSAALRI
jgi:hypothetical protein